MTTSVAKKLYIRVILGSLLGASISGFLSYRVLETRIKKNLQNSLNLKVNYIEAQLFQAQQLTDSTSIDIEVLIENGILNKKIYENIILRRFKEITDNSNFVVAYGFVQKPRAIFKDKEEYSFYYAILNSYSELKLDKKDILNYPYNNIFRLRLEKENYVNLPQYIISSKSKEAFWFPTFYWNDLQSTIYIAPILDNNNNYLGSSLSTISIKPIKKILNEKVSQINQAGFYLLLDKNGTVIYHPSIKDTDIKKITDHDIPELGENWDLIKDTENLSGQYENKGNFIIYEKISGPDWVLIGVVPNEVVLIPVIITTLAGVLSTFIAISFVIYVFSLGLNKRLKKVSDQCLSILKRDLYRKFKSSFTSVEEMEKHQDQLDILNNYTLEDIYREYAIDNNLNQQKDEIDYLMFTYNVVSYRLEESIENLEITVEERTKKLEIEKERADSASRAKSEFLASVSHELRSPLNSIIGYTEILLRSRKILETEKPKLEIINNCSYQLLSLINDILDITKIETRKLELVKTLFVTDDFLNSLLDTCYSSCAHKGIKFIFNKTGVLPIGILSDEKRLRQVLINLLSNAIKFTKRGSVTFSVNGEKTRETLNGYLITFTIEDTGVGIPSNELDSIFKPFEQSKQTKKRFEGTGLGLNICTKILKELKSSINIESQVGVGSKFWFTVLLEGVNEGVVSKKNKINNNILSIKGEAKTILIIDDLWENRLLLNNLLEPLNFIVIEAENGLKALEMLNVQDIYPDLIISDISMPILDGFGFLLELRKNEKYKDIPVIISSASVFDSDRLNSIKAGAVAFIPKPLNYDELLTCIKTILNIDWNYDKENIESTDNLSKNS